MTTPHCSFQVGKKWAHEGGSQQQHIPDHASETQSHDMVFRIPQAKKVCKNIDCVITSSQTLDISTDDQTQPYSSHQLFDQNPSTSRHFLSLQATSLAASTSSPLQPNSSSGDAVQQVQQAPPSNIHGKTTSDHIYQASHEQLSQGQPQEQDVDITGHVLQRQTDNTSKPDINCDTPPAKRAHLETPMDQFISYIKQTYLQSVVERSLNVIKWPPTPSKIFINLACIDWRTVVNREEADEFTRAMVEDGNVDVIMKKKIPIEFSDIVRDLPDTALERLILVEGAPGVGKSTFAWELCRRWERGEIAQQYKLVLLLRLRDERMSKAQSLRDLLYHPKGSIGDAVEKDLIDTFGDKCLIILEGFDELPDECRTKSSIFLELINGQLLPLAPILVTSRPWATSALLSTCYHNIFKHIEILGFTETHIEEYVRSVFIHGNKLENGPMQEKDIEDIMTYIATYPQIKACMYIPLNSAIVVSVYQESKAGGCILPKTLTELYNTLIQILLLRYLRGHLLYSKKVWNIQSLENDLPEEVYKQLLRISEIAYKGICTDWGESVQLIFSDLPPTFETLGLMQSVSQMYVTGVNVSHNFLHLTVQEFLAALHISNMSPEEQLEHFQRHKEGRFRVVLRFLAGLTKLGSISLEQRRDFLEPPNSTYRDMEYTQMISDVSVCAHHLNWMFETQSSDVIKTWLQDKTVDFEFLAQMSPLEYYSAGYCIAHSSANWVLTVQEDIEENALKMLCTGTSSADKADFKAKVKVLAHVTTEKLDILLTHLSHHIKELHLKIYDCDLSMKHLPALRVLQLDVDCKKTFNLTTSFPSQSLESLTIKVRSGSNAFRSGSIVLGPKTCTAVGNLLSSSKLLKHLCLTSRTIKGMKIGSRRSELIMKKMANNTSVPLKIIKLPTHMKMSDTAVSSLALFIQKCTTLEFVTWETDNTTLITACGLRRMANAQQRYFWLPPDATAWGHHCVVNCIEDGIDFDHIWQHHSFYGTFTCHNIGDEGACSFAASLIKNSTVRELYFNCNRATRPPVLTKVLHQSRYQLPNKKVSDAGATALAQALHHSSTLEKLDLSNNSVSDAGTTALAQALHHNSTLHSLNMSGNDDIHKEGTCKLVGALTVNTSISIEFLWSGLVLPKRCEEFATQCPEYSAVKSRVRFA